MAVIASFHSLLTHVFLPSSWLFVVSRYIKTRLLLLHCWSVAQSRAHLDCYVDDDLLICRLQMYLWSFVFVYIFSLSLSFASFLLLLIFVRLNLIVVYLSNLSKITRRQAQELFISKCPNNRFSGLIVPNMGNGQNFRLSEWSVVWSMYEIRADLACLKHNTEQRNVQSDMRVLFC